MAMKKKSNGWGGRREGAGRPKGTTMVENPRVVNVTFRVSGRTLAQIRQLREMMRDDERNFTDAFVDWVQGMADDYGV